MNWQVSLQLHHIGRVDEVFVHILTLMKVLIYSKRKSHNQRQKLAAIQRTARKLEGNMNPNTTVSQGNRKGSRR